MIFGLRRSPPPVIRLLRPDRSQACARLHAEGFAHPWSPDEMGALITSSSTVGAAALDPVSGRLRGFVLSRLAADEAEILTIAVDAAHQGRGVGRALLSENLRQVANAGAKALFLEVANDNAPALALYDRFGFVRVGERAGYYRRADGTGASALVMRKSLGEAPASGRQDSGRR
jgi:[ribosomal protein S18]-alanine N-acetyltransferase